jgi:CBS domain containing-hemolysin-like protein
MLFPALTLFLLFILLSALFSSFEKALLTANAHKLDYLEKKVILLTGFSRFPVHKGRLDKIEGVIQAKEIIPYVIENK